MGTIDKKHQKDFVPKDTRIALEKLSPDKTEVIGREVGTAWSGLRLDHAFVIQPINKTPLWTGRVEKVSEILNGFEFITEQAPKKKSSTYRLLLLSEEEFEKEKEKLQNQ